MKKYYLMIGFALTCFISMQAMASSLSPDQGGPRNWEVIQTDEEVILFDHFSSDAKSVQKLNSGDILDNLDCRTEQDEDWCYVQPLGGGPVGYAKVKFLIPAKAKDGTVGYGMDDSAIRAGQGDFDAKGNIPCALHKGQPMTQCAFSVSRAGSGYATLVIHRKDKHDRIVFFRLGKAIGVNSSEADKVGVFSETYEDDLHFIKIDEERYEVPDAVIYGG